MKEILISDAFTSAGTSFLGTWVIMKSAASSLCSKIFSSTHSLGCMCDDEKLRSGITMLEQLKKKKHFIQHIPRSDISQVTQYQFVGCNSQFFTGLHFLNTVGERKMCHVCTAWNHFQGNCLVGGRRMPSSSFPFCRRWSVK